MCIKFYFKIDENATEMFELIKLTFWDCDDIHNMMYGYYHIIAHYQNINIKSIIIKIIIINILLGNGL